MKTVTVTWERKYNRRTMLFILSLSMMLAGIVFDDSIGWPHHILILIGGILLGRVTAPKQND